MALFSSHLEQLRSYYNQYGALPTYEEAQKLFRYKSKSTAYYAVNKLIHKGFLRRNQHKLLPGSNFTGIPYFQSVRAGFPGPAEEETNDRLSLDQYMIDRPNSTILIRVKGDSMTGLGIFNNDIVIVERGRPAKNNDIVVVNLEGEFTVKTLSRHAGELYLNSSNPDYPNLRLADFTSHDLIGVVKGVLRKY